MKTVCYDDEKIYINGKATKIISGAMHYFRIMPEYWHDRLLKLKEMGCNTVETYCAWNLHEKQEGVFDFSGWLDFSKFLDIAKELGLYAIVRPGPYICSEWDFGGMPWWLLSYPDIQLRCSNPLFLEKITPYLTKICEKLSAHLITNGGNVIFVQVENEYGSYGNDKNYLRWLKRFYEEHNIDCGLLTSDGETEFLLKNGTLPDCFASVNYRCDSERCISMLKKYHPGQPGAVLELWNGRGMRWGQKFERRDVDEVAESVKSALENAELVNLYMFHGGTTFGFMNGSLDFGEGLQIQMTSYDVDAPLDEYGRRTKKYYAEQKVITELIGAKIENTASDTKLMAYNKPKFIATATLSENPNLLTAMHSPTVKSMEECGQGYGYVIYETQAFIGACGAELLIPEIHDVAHVYIDKIYKASFKRGDDERKLLIEKNGEVKIDIVVENLGRVNYGIRLKDRKGLIGDLELHDIEYNVYSKIHGFTIYSMQLEKLPIVYKNDSLDNEPVFYKYELNVDEICDTVMHLDGFTRGVAFINGFNLGRHMAIENSENKLYIPAPLLKKGKNEIVIFDILSNNSIKDLRFGE